MYDIEMPPGLSLQLAEKNDLGAVKTLDELTFGSHQSITTQELKELLEFGRLILLFEDEILIGVSQVLLKNNGSLLPQMRIESREAYYYGTAIHPHHQGKGYGRLLTAAQDRCTLDAGKTEVVLSCRVENYPSLQLRLSSGFLIVDYKNHYYGPTDKNSARLILRKDLIRTSDPQINTIVNIPVCFSDEVDLGAHCLIRKALANNFIGTKMSQTHIFFTK